MAPAPTYPITGIQDGLPDVEIPGRIPLRVEVDDFYTLEEYAVQRNLFLLAMAKYEAMDPKEKLSYFQVAGIHGLPHQTWDDPNHPDPAKNGGYCPHNLITFPTWHRPYMLLFEQRVYEIMVNEVIPTFGASQHEQLKAEARKWRLPYWDWAAKKQRPGEKEPVYDAALILKDSDVKVTTSTGETTIPNPLYQFTAPGAMENWGIEPIQYTPGRKGVPPKYIDFQKCTATSKVPPGPNVNGDAVNASWIGGKQNFDAVTDNIRKAGWYQEGGAAHSLGEAVNRLLSPEYITSYRQFATARYEPEQNPRDALSWEGIHNNMHGWMGGDYGHLGHVPVAAFDPIFWMHHANIDRIFSIYQALYASNEEKSWWVSDKTPYTDANGKEQTLVTTPETPLTPFHTDDKGTIYNSIGVRNIAKLGYTYPELQRWNYPAGAGGDTEYIASIVARVHDLYAPPAKLVAARADYIVNVVYERFALGGVPFTVQIFLHDKLVGSVYSFSGTPKSMGGIDGCENCHRQEQAKILSSGQVTLTGALLASIEDVNLALTTLDKKDVGPYLKEHLRWRVLITGGAEIPLEEIPSLTVSLAFGGCKVAEITEHDNTLPMPIKGGMSQVRTGDSSERSKAGRTYEPVAGGVSYGEIFTDAKGFVYDTISITPDSGEASIRVALVGYREYEDLSL